MSPNSITDSPPQTPQPQQPQPTAGARSTHTPLNEAPNPAPAQVPVALPTTNTTANNRSQASESAAEAREAQRLFALLDSNFLSNYKTGLSNEEKTWKAVDIFLLREIGRRPCFDVYAGRYLKRARDVLIRFQDVLGNTQNRLVLFFQGVSVSAPFEDRNSLDFNIFAKLRDAMVRKFGQHPMNVEVESAFGEWRDEIEKGLDHMRSLKVKYVVHPENRQYLDEQLEAAAKCHDPVYMKKFLNILRLVKTMKKNKELPFVFICAPSGSGKTMFGLNFGQEEAAPSLHWLHNEEAPQTGYEPFYDFSTVINDAIKQDLMDHAEYFSSSENSASLPRVKKMLSKTPLRSIYLIVKYFQQLVAIKKAEDGQKLSWLQAQTRLEIMKYGKMSIFKARNVLETLAKEFDFPLSVFIDECSLLREDGAAHATPAEKQRLHFTRSLLRALRIVPILTGTDARTSNFCYPQRGGSRHSEEVWCFVLNDLPCYNLGHFERQCHRIRDGLRGHSAAQTVDSILNFLGAIRQYENPWLIELALLFLREQKEKCLSSPREILDGLLRGISQSLISRKNMFHAFTLGQLAYLMSHTMNRHGDLKVNMFDESCVNGHLARLWGTPDRHGEPFMSLLLKGKRQYYVTHEQHQFLSRSHYTPFFLAPLTGLVLFGLDSSHKLDGMHVPFVGSQANQRITALDAVHRSFPKSTHLTCDGVVGGKNSGTQTEVLFHAAAVVASRARGLVGCWRLEFMEHLFHELSTNHVALKPPAHGADDDDESDYAAMTGPRKLVVNYPHRFDKHKVPILAPMSAPGWPATVVRLLSSVSEEPVKYGVFGPSLSNDPVDSIIYECAVAPPIAPVPQKLTFSVPNNLTRVILETIAGVETVGAVEAQALEDLRAVEAQALEDVGAQASGAELQTTVDQMDNGDMTETPQLGEKRAASMIVLPVTERMRVKVVRRESPVPKVSRSAGEKWYGCLGGTFRTLEPPTLKACMVCECKQLQDNLTASKLWSIVKKFNTVPDCDFFIILALTVSDVFDKKAVVKVKEGEGEGEVEMRVFEYLNSIGYYFWLLADGQGDTLELKPVPDQCALLEDLKEVVIVGCSVIWGEDTCNTVKRSFRPYPVSGDEVDSMAESLSLAQQPATSERDALDETQPTLIFYC